MALPHRPDPRLRRGSGPWRDLQGDHDDPVTEEEPGRILHEVRFRSIRRTRRSTTGGPYFGTVDTTPLFVILVGGLSRWGLTGACCDRSGRSVDRAHGLDRSRGGRLTDDGYVTYRADHRSRAGQPGVQELVGRRPLSPMVGSPMPRSACARSRATSMPPTWRGPTSPRASDDANAGERRAATGRRSEKARFNRDFWCRGPRMVGDGAGRRQSKQMDALASNMGHCLASGIVDEAHVGARRQGR